MVAVPAEQWGPSISPSRSGRPSLLLEQRAGAELAELLANPVYYGFGIPHGDGQPVLLLPGFLGSDSYLEFLGGWLRRVGYRTARSGIILNAGSLSTLLQRVEDRAALLSGGDPRITIIGHSLGGIFARITAVARPDLVARVITLGAPLIGDPREAAHPLVRAVSEILLRREGEREALAMALLAAPLPENVQLASLYTRQDAIVDWRACLDHDPRATNIEVSGTHVGLAWNSAVYRCLGRLLPG